MKKIPTLVLVLFFAASGAQASIFSPIFKIGERIFARKGAAKVVEKTVMTHLDDAARVAGHNADDLAKPFAKTSMLGAGEASARTAEMLSRATEAERILVPPAAAVVKDIHRTPIRPPSALSRIVRPGNVLAAGGAAAVVLGTHNLTEDINKRPPDRNPPVIVARGMNRALVLLGGGIGLAALLRALLPAFPARCRRPAVIDVTPSPSSDPR